MFALDRYPAVAQITKNSQKKFQGLKEVEGKIGVHDMFNVDRMAVQQTCPLLF